MSCVGFRVWGLVFWGLGLGLNVRSLGFWGLGFGV